MKRIHPRLFVLLGLLASSASACAAAPEMPPAAPPAAAPPAPVQTAGPAAPQPEPADPFAVPAPLREESPAALELPSVAPVGTALPSLPKGIPAAPATCKAFAKRKPKAPAACKDASGALDALDAALAIAGSAERDAALAGVEACAALPEGLVRTLRADLAPPECADVLVEPLLAGKPPAGMKGIVHHVLFGQALGARLARAAGAPPTLAPPHDRKRVETFVKDEMAPWVQVQAQAIEALSKPAAQLASYGKAVAAVEAGMADLRIVEAFRGTAVPDDIAKDPDLRSAYEGAMEPLLDPRKARGRDAILVALRELASLGVLRDPRVERARRQLSTMYGGRRIDALDELVLPALPALAASSRDERLAARLPTFHAGLLLDPALASGSGMLRAELDRGVPPSHRAALRNAQLDAEARARYARARLELGRTYFRALDIDEAARLSAGPPGSERSEEATLVLSVALALRGGPEDAAQMMLAAPRETLRLGNVAALDAVAARKGRYAGIAAWNAALVRQIAAPQDARPDYFRDVARRFRDAAALVGDAVLRAKAEERARAAEATAAAVGGN